METTAQTTTQVATTKARAAYLVKRDNRTRCTFGKVWNEAVIAGAITDKDKLLAHAIKLKTGRASDLRKVKFETLLAKVQKALANAAASVAA